MQAVGASSERNGRTVVSLATRGTDGTNRRAAVGAVAPRRVEVGGVVLAYDDEGSGPPVVCLHAIGHGARDFERLRARLRGRHRVLALDWPGQGKSTSDTEPTRATRYAQLLDGFLAATRVERPVLIGNSIGGAAALHYAHAHPGDVRALVLENPGGLSPTNDRLAQLVLAAMAGFFAAGSRGARWFPAAFGAYYRSVLQRGAAREQRRRIVGAAYELAPLLEQAWRGFARPEEELRELAPGIACPVLFAWATRDQLVSLSRSRATIRRFSQARLERFPAGHSPHLETPEAFEASVERFLATVG
jgi:4,5:9,10-diseco-3-hydroxy-5,9,17-trioxoandrosta-1(10),2-diene-4-oate hydrolase